MAKTKQEWLYQLRRCSSVNRGNRRIRKKSYAKLTVFS
ncbi:hemolysin expression modulating family protein [Escherichia coli]|nr:hemolysin expression modulating family protein [Escherichia coli]ASC20155.1 hemolysin expression modulating family protein [Escherichia coli]PHG89897.1 hemolysin expression modulating family protein [Escherichia coli]RBV84267.1 hemolysin expression modulating family protein [Escherichia coli]RBV90365.1 hemolysin expression modulating family protein [Escherichia coli]